MTTLAIDGGAPVRDPREFDDARDGAALCSDDGRAAGAIAALCATAYVSGTARQACSHRHSPRILLQLSQRHERQSQAGRTPAHDALVRHMPPHDGLGPGQLHAYGNRAERLRHLSQRYVGERQAGESLRHDQVVRQLSPDDGLGAGDALQPRFACVRSP